jgi:hypothetical protein
MPLHQQLKRRFIAQPHEAIQQFGVGQTVGVGRMFAMEANENGIQSAAAQRQILLRDCSLPLLESRLWTACVFFLIFQIANRQDAKDRKGKANGLSDDAIAALTLGLEELFIRFADKLQRRQRTIAVGGGDADADRQLVRFAIVLERIFLDHLA